MTTRPPYLPARLLARVLRDDPAGSTILGDVHEDFHRVVDRRGGWAARCWYWREVFGLVLGRFAHRIRRATWVALRRHLAQLVEDGMDALRVFRRAPRFCVFTAVVIGLGVGGVTTVFSVLKPLTLALPFEDPHELVWISNVADAGDDSLAATSSRAVNLIDFRERAESFSGISGYNVFFSGTGYTLTGVGDPERLVGVEVAHDFLDVLGIEPLHGRNFSEEEGRQGGPPAIVLSHGFWRTRFAADPGIAGRTLTLNDSPRTVIGILPIDFDFSSVFTPGVEADFLTPFVVARDNPFQGNTLALVGRLRPGVTPSSAQAELTALVDLLQAEDPERWGLAARVDTLQTHLAGPFRPSLLLLAAAAGTLLLIVCVNVSGLMLARLPAQAQELAVRKALGARRARLMRQLLFEGLAISMLGAAIGSALSSFAVGAVRTATAIEIPLLDTVVVDTSAFAVAVIVAALTGVAVGTIPALQITDGDEAGVLRVASRGNSATAGARRLQDTLVVAEVTLACVLLVVGGLLLASYRAVLDVDLGFEPAHAVAWQLRPSIDFASQQEKSDFYVDLIERLETGPGVESAGLIDALPLGRNRSWPFRVVDRPAEQDTDEQMFPHVVDPGYLPTVGSRLVAGRNVAHTDREDTPRVVLLNATAARRIFGADAEAVGQRLRFWGQWEWEVVGVVEDVRHLSPEMGPGLQAYFPLAQMSDFTTMDLVVRSLLPTSEVVAAVSGVLRDVDPAMPTREFWSLDTTVRRAVSGRRFALAVLSAFGASALLLAGLGIYGVLARSVAERRREIGIRMALGASKADIVRDVVGRVLVLAVAGVVAGWVLAMTLSGFLASILFGVSRADTGAFVGTAVMLLAVTLVAAALPVRRALALEVAATLKAD